MKKLIHIKKSEFRIILKLMMEISITKNNIPLAIILVENEFRTFIIRCVEYLYLFTCICFKKEKALNISIGISQVKYKYWLEYYKNFEDFRIKNYFTIFEDPIKNYNLVNWYLSKHELLNSIQISEIYTGTKNIYYAKKIDKAMNRISEIQNLVDISKKRDIS